MQNMSPEYKLRLLMIYATVYPEKFEGDKGVKLMQVDTNSYKSRFINSTNYVSLLGLWFENMSDILAFPNSKISKDAQILIRFIFFKRFCCCCRRLVGKIDWIKLVRQC